MADQLSSDAERSLVIGDAESLIRDIEGYSSHAQTSDDYTWLSMAAVQWQTVFSSVLGIPRNINLAIPGRSIRLPEHSMLAADSDVAQWIKDTAFYFSKIRRAQSLLREVGDILQRAEEVQSASDYDVAADWHRAEVSFASEVVDGRITLGRLRAESYYRLEAVWLKEVKELKAFFIWKQTRGFADENYFSACEQIRQRLFATDKGSGEEFETARQYIASRYLSAGAVGSEPNVMLRHKLIQAKANRIWEVTSGRSSDSENWANAETYVGMFYESIIPAVAEKSLQDTVNVLQAFGFSKAPEHRYLIINAFEAALAICFLDAGLIRKALETGRLTWKMIL